MKNIEKSILALAAAFVASSMPASAQDLVAGWDIWSDGANPTASRLATDVTGTAITTLDEGENNENWRVNDGRGASIDGDWGTLTTTPPASIEGGEGITNECLELGNATTGGTITFTITNNRASDIVLGSFNFDSYAFRPKAARTYELSVVEGGGITPGVIYTSADAEIPSVGGAWDNLAHADIDHSLTELADHTLAPGESVDFLLVFSGGAGDDSGGHDLWIDNVAVFTPAGPAAPPISDVTITKSGTDVTLTFMSAGGAAIYRSSDFQNWIELTDGSQSPYFDEVDDASRFYYVLVPPGQAFP
jgi:hypothetical protein